jgi:RNA polymerase sigma factor (sigma-70 family)
MRRGKRLNRQLNADDGPLVGALQSIAAGDRAAFRSLYEMTAPKLFGVVLRIVRNRQVAEEVLQETYVRVWQSAERFAPEAGRPIAWLTTIARHRAIDRVRSDKVDQARADDDAMLERLAAPDSGDPVLREALTRCLDGLEEEARNCVVLAYCSGYSREELAERFGRPVGTIKTLLHRSVRLLKACLEQE